MNDLFRSELRRFWRVALIAPVVHLLLLQFAHRMTNLLHQTWFEGAPLFDAYMLLGVVFALLQVGSYRKPSQWLWLMHRPLPPLRIFGALALAALVLLVFVVSVPQLLLVVSLDLFTTEVVDVRHYLMLLHVLAFAMMAWLAGAHAALSRYKAAILVLALPLFLALHLVSVYWLLLPVLLALAWLGTVARLSFRADREAPPGNEAGLLLTALPLQLGFFLLAFGVGQFVYVSGSVLLGTDPLNTQYPPEGGLIETTRKSPAEVLALGLAHSDDPRAASWREQLPLLEPVVIGNWLQRYPVRHQFGNLPVITRWMDEERGILWTFSHDRMLFRGRDPKSGTDHGWWGLGGAGDTQPFPQVPIASGDGLLMLRNVVYAIDEDAQRPHELLRLPEDEWFLGLPSRELERLLLLTNRRLLAYRPDRLAPSKFAPPRLDFALPLPDGPAQLQSTHIAELMDGWLVSFLFGDGHRQIGLSQFTTVAEPWQQIVFVDDTGTATVVGERQIRHDYPPLQKIAWWISPVLHGLTEWPDSMLDKGLTWPVEPQWVPQQRSLQVAAVVLMLGSLVAALWWLHGVRMGRRRRAFWLASCALIGMPALLSMLCIERRIPRS